MSGAHAGEVAVIECRDGGHAEPFGDRDDGGIDDPHS